MDSLEWSQAGFWGTALLYPGRINHSNSFWRLDRATSETGPFDPTDPPQMLIPVEGGDPVMVTASVSAEGMASFVLTVDQTMAALAAGRMMWLDSGQIAGTVTVAPQ